MTGSEMLQHEETWLGFTRLLKYSAAGLVVLGLGFVAWGLWG